MKKIFVVLLGILLFSLGGFLLVRPFEAFSILGYTMGFVLLVDGFANITLWLKLKKLENISIWHLISAICSVIIALSIFGDIYFRLAFETFLVFIIAAWFIVTGFVRIAHAFEIKKAYNEKVYLDGKYWWVVLILGILLLFCGIFGIINPLLLVFALGMNIAINMIMCGVDLIILGIVI